MNTLNVKEILTATRDAFITNPYSWTKGTLTDGEGCYCLLGGIAKACDLPMVDVSTERFEDDIYNALYDNPAVLHLAYSIWPNLDVAERSALSVVYGLNDDPKTDLSNIIAALDNAIATA